MASALLWGRRAGNHQKGKTIGKKTKKNMTAKWKKREKNEKTKKTRSFLRVLDFSKMSHFGGLRASLGGRAGNPPKWKLWGAFPYKNLCKGNFGAARSSKMESLGNLSNFGDDFGDVFGDK